VALTPGQKIECSCGHKFYFGEDTLVRAENENANACPICGANLDLTGTPPGAEVKCENCGAALELAVEDEGGEGQTRLHAALPQGGAGIAPGTTLGRCRIEHELGRGAMGAVYLAQHLTLDIPVAVKVMLPRYGNVEEYKARFYREARTAARLNNPNVVRVHDCGEENGLLYLVMEYVDGGSVKDLLDAKGRLDVPEVVEIGKAVCRALIEAARHNIVHRDIKPDNIMRTSDGIYKLADLGLAKQISDQSFDAALTMASVSMGTPFYMAPEQAIDARSCDARADIYALGATLYHLLCGRPPFTGDKTYEIMQQHVSGTCPPPSAINRGVPPELDRIIGRAMMKKPEDRYESAAEMLEALQAFAGTSTSTGGTVPPPPKKTKRRRRRRVLIAAGAALFLLLLILSAGNDKRKRSGKAGTEGGRPPSADNGTQLAEQTGAFRVTAFEVVTLVRPNRKAEGSLDVEIELPVRPGPDDHPKASVRFRDMNYDMEATPEGRFHVHVGPTTPIQFGEKLTVALRTEPKAKATTLPLVVTAPPPAGPKPTDPEPKRTADPIITLHWELIPGEKNVHYRVEVGRLLINGDWQALYTHEAGVDVTSATIKRKELFAKLFGLAASTPLCIRYVAYKDVKIPGLNAWQRATAITEIRLSTGQTGKWKLGGSTEVTAWANSLDKDKSLTGANPGRCRELYSKYARNIVPPLWRLVIRGADQGIERFWAAYTLAEVCPREVAADGLALAIPSPVEQRRVLRKLFDDLSRTPESFPEAFRELLRDVQRSLRNRFGPISRGWPRPFPQSRR